MKNIWRFINRRIPKRNLYGNESCVVNANQRSLLQVIRYTLPDRASFMDYSKIIIHALIGQTENFISDPIMGQIYQRLLHKGPRKLLQMTRHKKTLTLCVWLVSLRYKYHITGYG